MHISQSLRNFRKKHRLQIQQLAKESGIDSPTVSRLENGWRPLTHDQIRRLQRAYEQFEIRDEDFFQGLIEVLGLEKTSTFKPDQHGSNRP